MRTRLPAVILALLLALGVVACDDTTEGLEEDAEQLEQDAGEELQEED